jgi:acyl carrier protein
MIQNSDFEIIQKALEAVNGQSVTIQNLQQTLVGDFNFESIDVVDFVFELESRIGLELDVLEMLERKEYKGNFKFNDLSLEDIVEYIKFKRQKNEL